MFLSTLRRGKGPVLAGPSICLLYTHTLQPVLSGSGK